MHEGLIVERHRDHLRIARAQIRATAQHFSAELIGIDFRSYVKYICWVDLNNLAFGLRDMNPSGALQNKQGFINLSLVYLCHEGFTNLTLSSF